MNRVASSISIFVLLFIYAGSAELKGLRKCSNHTCTENEVCDLSKKQCICKKGFIYDSKQQSCYKELELGQKCYMNQTDQCAEDEVCIESRDNPGEGICVCLNPFIIDDARHCTTGNTTNGPDQTNVGFILSIVIPVSFLLLCASCIFFAVKQKIVHRIYDRFVRVRRYELVSIGNDDDDDEPLVV